MSLFASELLRATNGLPLDLGRWMSRALESGWFEIGSASYDGGPGGTRCPVAAAATLAGAWRDGGIEGRPTWGDDEGPAPAVEDFAAYFDLCADELGLEAALEVVRDCLGRAGHGLASRRVWRAA